MSCEELTKYRSFLEEVSKISKDDEDFLQIKMYSYRLNESEINAEIINCLLQYLSDNKCPTKLQAPIIQNVLQQLQDSLKSKEDSVKSGYDENTKTFEPLKIKNYVLNRVKLFCQQLLDNVEFNKILPQLQQNNNFEAAAGGVHDDQENPMYAVGSIKNKRRYMEDVYTIINDFNSIYNIQNSSKTNFYAVFDGHDGFNCAYYSSSQLPYVLASNQLFLTNLPEAIKQSFLQVDSAFVEKAYSQSVKGGTTALVALHQPDVRRLYIAYVGDSKALLVKQGKILQVVEPHKPDNPRERKRILAAGGTVINWGGVLRVDGLLNLSRAIGDSKCKPHVTAEPDIIELELDNEEDFAILACDGLWDHLPADQVAQIVYQGLKENCEDLQNITRQLIEKAKHEGSADNITIVIVFLKHPSLIAKNSWNLEVVDYQIQHNSNLPIDECDEDEEKILKLQYSQEQNADEIDLLSAFACDKFNGIQKTAQANEKVDALLEEKFQEHFSSGKNFDIIDERLENDLIEQHNSELGEESEEDEWNYIQLKEGEGEKKIIHNNEVVPNNDENRVGKKENNEISVDLLNLDDRLDLIKLRIGDSQTSEQKLSKDDSNLDGESEISEHSIMENLINLNGGTPVGKIFKDDVIVAQSPRRGTETDMVNIRIPNEIEFTDEAAKRPHESNQVAINGVCKINLMENKAFEYSDPIEIETPVHKSETLLVSPIQEALRANEETNEDKCNRDKEEKMIGSSNNEVRNDSPVNQIKKCEKNILKSDNGKKVVDQKVVNLRAVKNRVMKTSPIVSRALKKPTIPLATKKPINVTAPTKTTISSNLKTLPPKQIVIPPEKKMLTTIKSRIDNKPPASLMVRKPENLSRNSAKKATTTISSTTVRSAPLAKPTIRPNSAQPISNKLSDRLPVAKTHLTKRLSPRETVSSALRKNELTKIKRPAIKSSITAKATDVKKIVPPTTKKLIRNISTKTTEYTENPKENLENSNK